MSGRPFRFDSESEMAAAVYQLGDHPDELLASFAADLTAQGFDVAGVVQGQCASNLGATRLAELQFTPAAPRRRFKADPTIAAPCSTTIARAETALMEAIARKPDLVLINRFGSFERSGGGLLGVLQQAIARDVPVLLAVPQALFGDWFRFSEGLAVKLDCRGDSLDQWWRSLGRGPVARPSATNFCEQFK